jgi:hypothetical protein
MSGTRSSSRRRFRPIAIALGAVLGAVAVALPASAERGVDQTVQVSYSGLGAERVKTVPITKNPGAKTRVVMSLPAAKVGNIRDGDSVWAGAEVEVSVTCLEPMPKCVGKIYHYSPHVKARLVLAPGPNASRKRNTLPIGKPKHLRCSQELPNRNHHCVLALDALRDVQAEDLPCDRCNVNLLLHAYHPKAKNGNVLVVGTDQDHAISQDKGTLNAAVHSPGPPSVAPDVERRPSRRRIPVGAHHSSNLKEVVVMSERVNRLKAGEQLVVDADIRVKTGHLRYSALLQSQVVLSEKPGSIRRNGVPPKVANSHAVVTAQNGFNCTPGKSGHKSPCRIRKLGVVRIFRDARTKPTRGLGRFVPLYVNLVMASKAEYGGERHRSGDVAKVAKGAKLSVTRYGPEFRP